MVSEATLDGLVETESTIKLTVHGVAYEFLRKYADIHDLPHGELTRLHNLHAEAITTVRDNGFPADQKASVIARLEKNQELYKRQIDMRDEENWTWLYY